MTATATATPIAAPAPTFAAVAVDKLPSATRTSSPESIAMGNAILAVILDGKNAAQESTIHADAKTASKRAAVLKRAVTATGKVPAGRIVGARIIPSGDGFAVAVVLANPKPRKAKPAEPETVAETPAPTA